MVLTVAGLALLKSAASSGDWPFDARVTCDPEPLWANISSMKYAGSVIVYAVLAALGTSATLLVSSSDGQSRLLSFLNDTGLGRLLRMMPAFQSEIEAAFRNLRG